MASAGLEEATALAERVHASVAQPYTLGERVHQVGASIGVAVAEPQASRHGTREMLVTPEELLQRADLAMYAAKQAHEAWRAYDPGMRAAVERRADADHEITRAWGADSVRLYLQPIVRAHDLTVHSVEALLRWVGADGRVVGPATVLDDATRTGQMTRLTQWVVSGTVESLRRIGSGGVPVSINLPTALLDVEDVAPRLEDTLRRGGLRPADVHLELTEEAMVDRGPRSAETMQNLRARGFRVYVDDFGTGYSSLSYLVHLPIDGIKIDRAFVRDLPTSVAARSIGRALVAVSEELGVELVAEGVETGGEAAWVERLGVPLAQGFWYARPADAARLPSLRELASWGSFMGAGGVRHTTPSSFALGGAEC